MGRLRTPHAAVRTLIRAAAALLVCGLAVFFVLAGRAVSLGPGLTAARGLPAQSPSAPSATAWPIRLLRPLSESSPVATPSTTTTTAPAPAAAEAVTPITRPAPAPTRVVTQSGYGCAAALAYLAAHEAPGFRSVCPGYADGHEGMTCMNQAPICPGERIIVIADPCPNAYMNEASNSWVVLGLSRAPIDPYGSCWS